MRIIPNKLIPNKLIPKKDGAKDRPPAGAAAVSAAGSLRTRGLRLTGPRRIVLEVVRGSEAHPTAEAVHRLVRRRLPRVSLGTVYRNLRLLVAEGLVHERPGPHARFDGKVERHHHFTCTDCGRIVDVDGPLCDPPTRAVSARVAALTGLTITHHRIEFFGRCPACRPAPGRRGPDRPPRGRSRRSS